MSCEWNYQQIFILRGPVPLTLNVLRIPVNIRLYNENQILNTFFRKSGTSLKYVVVCSGEENSSYSDSQKQNHATFRTEHEALHFLTIQTVPFQRNQHIPDNVKITSIFFFF